MDYGKEALRLHKEWKGKIGINGRIKIDSKEELSLAYTPGVAAPCIEISKDVNLSYDYTRRGNLIAVVTDGTAVLGLGDIGPEAAMPVMEGKSLIFKEFAGVEAFPLCIKSKDVDEIVRTLYLLSGSFGGINLEDISAPRCFEIERKLKEICDIPIFHDDQHGTAVVTLAATLNALALAGKNLRTVKIVVNGAGSAGIAVAKLLMVAGASNILLCDSKGIICEGDKTLNSAKAEMAKRTNREKVKGSLADAIKGADIFIGLSVADCVTEDMVRSMADKPILFPMANPNPEIAYEKAINAGAFIVGTGRSDYPNQINNALVFPGIFRGALDVRASDINEDMQTAAAFALAGSVREGQLRTDYILPKVFDKEVHRNVAKTVAVAAMKSKVARV